MESRKQFKQVQDIKVGVIGYGATYNISRAHFNEMQKAGMQPFAVAETDPVRLAEAKKDFPQLELYNSAEEMLAKSSVDLVTVVTPHNTHAQLSLKCLSAGKHVVCEKPLAITTDECDNMIAAAHKNNLVLSTYHNRHWDGHMLQALKTVRSGMIGDVVRIKAHMAAWGKPQDWWRSSKSISGGILYDWGVHILEYALQIIDSEMTEVSGFLKTGFWAGGTKWKDDTNEDEGMAVVRFKNGVWLSLIVSSIDVGPAKSLLEITGTRGTYLMDFASWEVINGNDKGEIVKTSGKNPPAEGWRFYQNIADHLTKGEKLVITPEWARRPIHIIDLACQSAKLGHALKPKYV